MEKMSEFFAARVEGYDEHMLNDVEGCREGYLRMAGLLPADARELLDLGCGTGLELDAIFRNHPHIRVTGIDLTPEMLDRLRTKYPDEPLTLICASYFDYDLGSARFDAAVSFESLHHYTHEEKLGLYRRIRAALKPGGIYIECDYMVEKQEEEDSCYRENLRLREELGIGEGEYYHFDTPCTVKNQIKLLVGAGFHEAQALWREGNTTLILATKKRNQSTIF